MPIAQVETEDAEAQAAIFRGIDAYSDAVSDRPEPGRAPATYRLFLLFLTRDLTPGRPAPRRWRAGAAAG
jgi:hypothetical protein